MTSNRPVSRGYMKFNSVSYTDEIVQQTKEKLDQAKLRVEELERQLASAIERHRRQICQSPHATDPVEQQAAKDMAPTWRVSFPPEEWSN